MKTTKATKAALTGLEWAIAQTIEHPRQPDEFTASEMLQAAQGTASLCTIQRKLKQLHDSGTCTRRKIGNEWLYRKA